MEISIISLEHRKGEKLGEPKKVRRGHARYLIRTKKALRYDKADVEQFAQMRVALEQQETEKLQQAQTLAEKLSALSVKLASRAASEGRLYGSLGPREIAEAITLEGVAIQKADVHLPTGHIHQVGDHEAVIRLHDQVEVKITIQVVPDFAVT
jgi:large subunit ribosomal protein L9